jgi:hypothetical protein
MATAVLLLVAEEQLMVQEAAAAEHFAVLVEDDGLSIRHGTAAASNPSLLRLDLQNYSKPAHTLN